MYFEIHGYLLDTPLVLSDLCTNVIFFAKIPQRRCGREPKEMCDRAAGESQQGAEVFFVCIYFCYSDHMELPS
jgi:hypothetical protein